MKTKKVLITSAVILLLTSLLIAFLFSGSYKQYYTEKVVSINEHVTDEVLSIGPNRFEKIRITLKENEYVNGSLLVENGAINLFLMSKIDYLYWIESGVASGLLIERGTSAAEFSVKAPVAGEYVLVLQNPTEIERAVHIEKIVSWRVENVLKYRYVYDYTLYVIPLATALISALIIATAYRSKYNPEFDTKLILPGSLLIIGSLYAFLAYTWFIDQLELKQYLLYSATELYIGLHNSEAFRFLLLTFPILTSVVILALKAYRSSAGKVCLLVAILCSGLSINAFLTDALNAITIGLNFALLVFLLIFSKILLGVNRGVVFQFVALIAVMITSIITVSASFSWVYNLFIYESPFSAAPYWKVPRVEFNFVNSLQPVVLFLVFAFLASWLFYPVFSRKVALTAPPERISAKIVLISVILVSFLGALIVFSPYLHKSEFVGVDTPYYYRHLVDLDKPSDIISLVLSEPSWGSSRPLYISLAYAVREALAVDSVLALKIAPMILAALLPISTYAFTSAVLQNRALALLSSILSVFSVHVTSGMYAGIFANWLAFSLILLMYASLAKSITSRNNFYLLIAVLLSILALFAHLWSWGMTMIILFLFSAVNFILWKIGRLDKHYVINPLLVFIVNIALLGSALFILKLQNVSIVRDILLSAQHIARAPINIGTLPKVYDNLSFAIVYYVGGSFNFAPLFLFALIGSLLLGTVRSRCSHLLAIWLAVIAVYILTTMPYLQWRFLYTYPSPVLIAVAIYSLIKLFEKIAKNPSTIVFNACLILAVVFSFINYAMRTMTVVG